MAELLGKVVEETGKGRTQHVLVMRHGDRIDAVEPLWQLQANRAWDPPLTDAGKIRAWTTGKRLRAVDFPIHRVIVSPFLRCLQTAAEVITALCCVVDDDTHLLAMETSEGAVIDTTRVKAYIEYGLCEVLSTEAMGIVAPPKDGIWFPDILDLEAFLPAGTLDFSVDRLYQQLPTWEEPLDVARERFDNVIQALADKFPHENLLLDPEAQPLIPLLMDKHDIKRSTTHWQMRWEAVGVSISSHLKDAVVYEVEYCAYAHLQRQVSSDPSSVADKGAFRFISSSQAGLLFN